MLTTWFNLQSGLSYVLGLFILGLVTLKLLWKPKYFPPEVSKMFSLQFLGHTLFGGGMQRTLIKFNDQLKKPFCTINIGVRKIVLLNTHDAMREAFQKTGDAVTGRPKVAKLRSGGFGVLGSEGRLWKEQRRFSLATLRDFGMGKIRLEDKVLDEAAVFVSKLDELDGKPVDVWKVLGTCISNVICSVVFGRAYDHDDPTCDLFLNVFNSTATTGATQTFLTGTLPFLRFLPGDPLQFYDRQQKNQSVDKIIMASIEDHRRNLDAENIGDFIDAYLVEMESQSGKEDTTFTDNQLRRLVFDLFIAGSETTATTLKWGLKYMMLHPDIQEKVQQEIDDVIGQDRPVRMSDRPSLPYTERVIMETQRLANLVILVGHRCLQDVTIGGYTLCEDTMVISNLYRMHTNEQIWPNPHKFDPDNFVDSEGKTTRREFLVPFALGKRACLGESLAKMELFLFFVTLLQKFTFKVPDGQAPPGIKDDNIGIVRSPKNYELSAIRRH